MYTIVSLVALLAVVGADVVHNQLFPVDPEQLADERRCPRSLVASCASANRVAVTAGGRVARLAVLDEPDVPDGAERRVRRRAVRVPRRVLREQGRARRVPTRYAHHLRTR